MFGPGISLHERERVYRRRLSVSGVVGMWMILVLAVTIRPHESYVPPRAGYPGPMMLLPELDIIEETISEKRQEAGGHPLEEAMEAVDMDLIAEADDYPEERDGSDEREFEDPEDEPLPGEGVGRHTAAVDASVIPITSDQIVLLRFVKAMYPLDARLMGVEGRFLLHALVGPDGSVVEARVSRKDINSSLIRAAREAVLKWRFAPVKQRGSPIQFWVEIPFQFTLEETHDRS